MRKIDGNVDGITCFVRKNCLRRLTWTVVMCFNRTHHVKSDTWCKKGKAPQ